MTIKSMLFAALAGAVLVTASCGGKDDYNNDIAPEPPTPGKNTHKGPSVIFIGDSITWQWTRSGFHPEYFNTHGYVNKGISGNTTVQMHGRFQDDVIALDPYCVVIEGGTNDIAKYSDDSILNRLEEMVDMALAKKIDVVLGSVPPSNLFPKVPGFRPQDRIAPLNAKIKALATSKGIVYADYYSVLVDDELGLKTEYQKDTVHPNKQGYMAMETVIEPILANILKKNN
ncbi:MAG: hypothetical protein IK143_06235 [Bacteroidales bacterium]|nr:hypothetical protein [Bacteroidales bacterium]